MSLYTHHSDHELFSEIAAGNHAAFAQLSEKFRSNLLCTAAKWSKSKDDAMDIVQDTFLGLWTSREKLREVKDPAAYLYTALFYTINRWLRQVANRNKILAMPWPEHALHMIDPALNDTELSINCKESERMVNNALQQLPPQKQLIYRLTKEEGHTHEEIGHMLELSPLTIKSYMKETLRFIRSYLKNAALNLLLMLTAFFL